MKPMFPQTLEPITPAQNLPGLLCIPSQWSRLLTLAGAIHDMRMDENLQGEIAAMPGYELAWLLIYTRGAKGPAAARVQKIVAAIKEHNAKVQQEVFPSWYSLHPSTN